ncbi:MAG: MAPEG family protein [Pseudomonadota bacterium]
MLNSYVIFPMFAMVLVSFTTLVLLFMARTKSVREGTISAGFFKTYQNQTEPEANLQLSRHFVNLFESPVLFYAVCISALATQNASTTFQIIAWGYVIARVAHMFVHIGSNTLNYRIAAYFTSWIILLILWVLLCVEVAGIG